MATEILEIDDDEISVIYSKPNSLPKGSTKANAISVEDYKPKRVFDFDDELIILSSSQFPKKSTFFKGECSNSKPLHVEEPKKRIPSISNCEICADEKPRSEMFRILGCSHFYCNSCIENYVSAKLQDNVTRINCPVPDCKGYLEPYHCRSILPKEVFDRWGDALCEAVILGSEKFYCPFKDCSALLIDDGDGSGEDISFSECPYCHRLFCWKCKVPWHGGITCEEFNKLKTNERSNEDIMLMRLAKSKNWQRCSKCGYYVEKKDGCLYMKCRCGHSFCYSCGAPMSAQLHYCQVCKH